MRLVASSAAALALIGASTAALAAEPAAAPAAAEAPKPKPKKICRSDPRATGTRLARRVCKTEEEWAKPQDGAQIQTQGRGGNPDPGSSTGPLGR